MPSPGTPSPAPPGTALAATYDPDPLVREAAAIAVAVTSPPGARERLGALRADEDPAVARYARYWAVTGGTGIDPEDEMYTTIEKVLFLQRVPLFSRVAGDDLVALARGSLVVSLVRGDVIFRQGEPGGALYSIISGEVSLTLDGREIARLGANDVFGEMSLFDSEPRALDRGGDRGRGAARVSAEDFHEAVRETAEIADAVIQVLNRRLREADRKLADAHARLSLLRSRRRCPGERRPGGRDAGARRQRPRLRSAEASTSVGCPCLNLGRARQRGGTSTSVSLLACITVHYDLMSSVHVRSVRAPVLPHRVQLSRMTAPAANLSTLSLMAGSDASANFYAEGGDGMELRTVEAPFHRLRCLIKTMARGQLPRIEVDLRILYH